MNKDDIEEVLVEYGVQFTNALSDKLLEMFNKELEPCDAISRKSVYDILHYPITEENENIPYEDYVWREVQKLPSVTPKSKLDIGYQYIRVMK